MQLIVNEQDMKIQHAYLETEGRKSDFRIFKESKVRMEAQISLKADLGYLGITRIHANAIVPVRKPRNGELNEDQLANNKEIRKKRIRIEHVNRLCKCFRIVKETYRNSLRKIERVWKIVCGLVNLNLEKMIVI
jgi:hypothetical protein